METMMMQTAVWKMSVLFIHGLSDTIPKGKRKLYRSFTHTHSPVGQQLVAIIVAVVEVEVDSGTGLYIILMAENSSSILSCKWKGR